jgi:hypothetical protein
MLVGDPVRKSQAMVTEFINQTLAWERTQFRKHCQELFGEQWREEWEKRKHAAN